MNYKTVLIVSLVFSTLWMAPFTVWGSETADNPIGVYFENLAVIGELEQVTFKPQALTLKARIDTGAKTSSIGIVSQQTFERDGKKWVHFSVINPSTGKMVKFERPLVRTVKIKRHGADPMRRNVIKLKIILSNIESESEFTLADRSQYNYPVLIGRNVLSGRYIVDVNRRFSTHHTGEIEE